MSIVVLSHDYEQYLAQAIDSALEQRQAADVLVVDDGSTDGSRDIIDAYGDRLRRLYKPNGGNSSAVNAAVRAVTSDVVMFLDADDRLCPDAVGEVRAAWSPDVAKVQFRLRLVDADGHARGLDPPAWVPMPEGDVVPELLRTGRYVTPVMTGNAFARRALEAVLPIPEDDFRNTDDGYLNMMVPFHGTVRSLDRALGWYRLHGRNLWAYTAGVRPDGLRQRVGYDLARSRHLAETARAHGHPPPEGLLLRDPVHVLQRVASLRTDPARHPVPDDRLAPLLLAGLRAARATPTALWYERVELLAGTLAVGLLPRAMVPRAVDQVLGSRPRPEWVRALAGRLRRRPVRRHGEPAGTGARRPSVLTTLYFPRRRAWVAQAEMLDRTTLGPARLVATLLLRARRHDVVVLDGGVGRRDLYVDRVAAACLARLPGSPPVVITDATWTPRTETGRGGLRRRLLHAFDGPRTVYCVLSSEELEGFPERWGVPADRVVHTPFYWTLEALAEPTEGDGSVFAGGDSSRDHDTVLAAAERLPDLAFTVATTTPAPRPVPPHVRYAPAPADRFLELMVASSVVVVMMTPGLLRSAGQQTYLNAMALGKAVVVSDSPGVRDVVRDGVNGLIVPPGDAHALSAALAWLRSPENAEEVAGMRARARSEVVDRFSPEAYVRRLLRVVEEVAQQR